MYSMTALQNSTIGRFLADLQVMLLLTYPPGSDGSNRHSNPLTTLRIASIRRMHSQTIILEQGRMQIRLQESDFEFALS